MNKIKFTYLLLIGLFFTPSLFAKGVIKDTVCINMQTINSTKDDYMPFLVDKKTLVFTSNRKSSQEGQTVEYTEKVYWTNEKSRNNFTPPKKTGYKWNSDNNTSLIAVSPSLFYFYRSYWKDNGEIFVAQRMGDRKRPWLGSKLRKMSRICTEFDENSIATTNTDSVFFVSNRNGNYDIFVQTANNPASPIDSLNTEFNENDVFFNTQTQMLYFSSDRPNGIGGYDIYESRLKDNTFSKPRLLRDTMINTTSDDRDFKKYNDSTMYFSSNRMFGLGGYDIYKLTVKTTMIPDTPDIEINLEDTRIIKDSLKSQKEELYAQLKELGLFPFRGEVQVGAYRYIPSLDAFLKRFPCITHENIREDELRVDGMTVHKYIIDTIYTDVDIAVNKQVAIEALHCLPDELFSDMPFIGMLDKQENRYAIFWKRDEFEKKKLFFIFKNGKMIWKSRRF